MNKEDTKTYALNEFDKVVDKHLKKIRNALNGIVAHAHAEGHREAQKDIRAISQEERNEAFLAGMRLSKEDVFNKGYDEGIIAVWTALNDLLTSKKPMLNELYNFASIDWVITNLQPKDIIEAVENKKKEYEEEEHILHVGDEVKNSDGIVAVVTYIANAKEFHGMMKNGNVEILYMDEWVKTGRNFGVKRILDHMGDDER